MIAVRSPSPTVTWAPAGNAPASSSSGSTQAGPAVAVVLVTNTTAAPHRNLRAVTFFSLS